MARGGRGSGQKAMAGFPGLEGHDKEQTHGGEERPEKTRFSHGPQASEAQYSKKSRHESGDEASDFEGKPAAEEVVGHFNKGKKVHKGYAKGGRVEDDTDEGESSEHGYRIVGKRFGAGDRGNEGRRREWEDQDDEAQVEQDPREGLRQGENVNFYKNMIHHGEGGMVAPGDCPLTVGPGEGSKRKMRLEKLRPAGE